MTPIYLAADSGDREALEMNKANLSVNPLSGAEMEKIVASFLTSSRKK